eukprot:ANDGO_08380.mRNA.1 putative UDP-N-acetylglucosamine--peptide N-acetylglucosaminyltransferase S2.4.1.-
MDAMSLTYDVLSDEGRRLAAIKTSDAQQNALRCFEVAAHVASKLPAAWLALAQQQHALNMMEASKNSYEMCLKRSVNMKHPACLGNLGNLYREMRQFDLAEQYLTSGLEVSLALLKQQKSGRTDDLRQSVSAILSNLGILMYEKGNLEEAFKYFARGVEAYPESSDAQYNLGNLLRDHGKVEDAIKRYRSALSMNPKDEKTVLNLANCLLDMGLFQESTDVLDQHSRVGGSSVSSRTLYSRALSVFRLGQFERSKALWMKLLNAAGSAAEPPVLAAGNIREVGGSDNVEGDSRANVARVDFSVGRQEHAFKRMTEVVESAEMRNENNKTEGLLAELLLYSQAVGVANGHLATNVSKALLSHEQERKGSVIAKPADLAWVHIHEVNDSLLLNISNNFVANVYGRIARLGRVPMTEFDGDEKNLSGSVKVGILADGFSKDLDSYLRAALDNQTELVCFQRWSLRHHTGISSRCDSFYDLSALSHSEAADRIYSSSILLLLLSQHISEMIAVPEIVALHPATLLVTLPSFADGRLLSNGKSAEYILIESGRIPKASLAAKGFHEKLVIGGIVHGAEEHPATPFDSSVDLSQAPLLRKSGPVIGVMSADRRHVSSVLITEILPEILSANPDSIVFFVSSTVHNNKDHARLQKTLVSKGVDPSRIRFGNASTLTLGDVDVCIDGYPVGDRSLPGLSRQTGCKSVGVCDAARVSSCLNRNFWNAEATEVSEIPRIVSQALLGDASSTTACEKRSREHLFVSQARSSLAIRRMTELNELGFPAMHILL